jgi:inner membrane protein
MDNVTHSLVGLMLARVSGKNTAMMVVAANLPDIDVISWAGGTLSYIDDHRGIAHSLAAAPVWALILILLFRSRTVSSYLWCLTGVLSHLLLDWTNAYGIRLLDPFSGRWLHLDMTDVVDPWILLVFLLAVAAPWLAGLVGAEIGARKTSTTARAWAGAALIFLIAYEGARFAAHHRAVAEISARLYDGNPPVKVSAIPSRWTPFEWRGVVETATFVVDVPVDLNAQFDPLAGRIAYPGTPNQAALQTRPFEIFARFNQLPFWKSEKLADGTTRVQLLDLRFGTPDRPGFQTTAILEGGQVTQSTFELGRLPVGNR